jgi:hypothetical protein
MDPNETDNVVIVTNSDQQIIIAIGHLNWIAFLILAISSQARKSILLR